MSVSLRLRRNVYKKMRKCMRTLFAKTNKEEEKDVEQESNIDKRWMDIWKK